MSGYCRGPVETFGGPCRRICHSGSLRSALLPKPAVTLEYAFRLILTDTVEKLAAESAWELV